MATDNSATIHHLHQPKRALTDAERAKRYRLRKKAGKELAPVTMRAALAADDRPGPARRDDRAASPKGCDTASHAPIVTPSRRSIPSIMLAVSAFGLAIVGITMNGWFARSLGSSDIAGWLFLAVGVAADLVALAVPSTAARLWHARRRATAGTAWIVWAMTFAFAVTAGIGFASVNITDVTTARAGRVTPAVTAAQAALSDAMTSRDRECVGGVGKNCRQREEAVIERRKGLDIAMKSVEQTADPQTEAAIKIVAWVSLGMLKPSGDDFGMMRLILLALLPQIGGILLMLCRAPL